MGMPKIALIMKYESSSLPFEGMGFSTNDNPRLMKNLESPKNTRGIPHAGHFPKDSIFVGPQFPACAAIRHDLRSSPPPLFDLVRKVPEITVEVP